MKKLLLSLVAIATLALNSFGQSPEGFKYQAVIREAGTVLNNQSVGIRMTVQQGSIGGTEVYQETFVTTTNGYGLVNLEIGTGTTTDDFTSIDWSAGPYFIETAVDVTGGTSYAVMGTSQLMSVPYALHAKTAGNGITPSQSESITNNEAAVTSLLTELEALKNSVAVLELEVGIYNPAGNIQDNLDNGVSILDLLDHVTVDELYGKTYEGGLIFYVNETDGTGLVAAPTDQASATWGCYGTLIDGADGAEIGTGAQNTLDILAGCSETGTAAQLCADLVLNEKEDWFFPSKDELNAMYVNLKENGFGGFAVNYYWSSTEGGSDGARSQYFNNGDQGNYFGKFGTFNVRAVRAF